MLYTIVLSIHSVLRWLVVIAGLIAIVRAFSGWLGKKEWSAFDERLGIAFTSIFDLQVLVGLILYFFLSPITTAALRNFGAAMGNSGFRFFSVEHILMMLVAMGVAHVGRSMSKKAVGSRAKFMRAALWFTLSFVILFFAIPWPFMAVARPWIRLG